MKRFYFFVTIFFLSISVCNGQTTNQNPADSLSMRIATRMRDSLNLTDVQKMSIYYTNLRLHQEKLLMRREYTQSQSILTQKLQLVESTRDSLYQIVLSAQQYIEYKSKKQLLIRN